MSSFVVLQSTMGTWIKSSCLAGHIMPYRFFGFDSPCLSMRCASKMYGRILYPLCHIDGGIFGLCSYSACRHTNVDSPSDSKDPKI